MNSYVLETRKIFVLVFVPLFYSIPAPNDSVESDSKICLASVSVFMLHSSILFGSTMTHILEHVF